MEEKSLELLLQRAISWLFTKSMQLGILFLTTSIQLGIMLLSFLMSKLMSAITVPSLTEIVKYFKDIEADLGRGDVPKEVSFVIAVFFAFIAITSSSWCRDKHLFPLGTISLCVSLNFVIQKLITRILFPFIGNVLDCHRHRHREFMHITHQELMQNNENKKCYDTKSQSFRDWYAQRLQAWSDFWYKYICRILAVMAFVCSVWNFFSSNVRTALLGIVTCSLLLYEVELITDKLMNGAGLDRHQVSLDLD